jgi:MEMO1 family protein
VYDGAVSETLPALRRNLDVMPSPVPERPGLLIRDPFRYAESVLIIPSPLVPCLAFFNGEHLRADVAASLVRVTGDIRMSEVLDHLLETLSREGFLENDVFEEVRARRHQAFTDATRREPVHAGQAYPAEMDPLRETLARYLDGHQGRQPAPGHLLGIAAPHVSPEGGWQSYRAAYAALMADGLPKGAERTFVILGTSHYGEPEAFGLTRKPFLTPLGEAAVDTALVDALVAEGGPAVRLEDYCHSVEHSIEFQVVFLQHLFGPALRIVPVLCGAFARSTRGPDRPEDDEGVRRFLEALAGLQAREGARLRWVLGVDMAHVGRRYGDPLEARVDEGPMVEVGQRDRRRCARLAAGDAAGFWELIQEDADPLKWCGASPLYTFLKAVAPARGELLHYEQWNIDEASVVSFAGMSFHG